ncbi:hypothetical protein ACEPPU_24330 [Priestia aryabhattai]|uniref:hypothetical protein n=1 Tax=Priestia aryabhattai TaxID=412384 RepID=UPI0035ABD9F2
MPFEMVNYIISLFENSNGTYSVYRQGVNVETEEMQLVPAGNFLTLEDARREGELLAAQSDCVLIETISYSRQIMRDVNEEMGK